ncbi:MAG: putative ABC transport system permease protein [Myxococcota bacterium]|jgi:putative ABC transport system permease protein
MDLGTTLSLALRNLRRRPGRTALTVGMIFVSTVLIVFSVGLQEGMYSDMYRMATHTWTGHAQVLAEGYKDKPGLFKNIDDPQAIVDKLRDDPRVAGVTARVESGGLFAQGRRTAAAQLVGVDAANEQKVSSVANTIAKGSWFGAVPPLVPSADPVLFDDDGDGQPDPFLPIEDYPRPKIVLGDGLARLLRAELGMGISFLGQGADGAFAAENFIVVGIVDTGVDELDRSMAFVGKCQMQPPYRC